MILNRLDLLIEILVDHNAREDERHDAAMDIGSFIDDRALNVLLQIGSNPYEEVIIQDACGESIAKILVSRNELKKDLIDHLTPIAKKTAYAFIKENKPEWINAN